MRWKVSLILILVLIVVADLTWAQTVSSSVKGVVVDTSKGVIPGATCELTNQATGRVFTALSSDEGAFTFPNVTAGTYTLKIGITGFKTLVIKDVVVNANEVRTLGVLALEIGEVQQSVSVTAEVAVASVQLASGEKSGLVSGEQINNIALKGRDFWALLQTLPGVVDDYSQGRETPNSGSNRGTSINGGSTDSKNYSVDGVYSLNTSNSTTVVQPNMDAVAEVKVLTSNYQAEYGRMSSGVISVITKSGTQDFRGSGWATYRHEQLNANNFFNNAKGTPKTPYRYHIYGYSIGGPVFIPGRFNTDKSKLFFFFSQEFSPIKQNHGQQLATTPTEAEREGDFSNSRDVNGALIVVKDPTTGQPFANNRIPANRFSPAGQALLKAFPLPNFTDPDPKNLYRWNLRSTFSGSTDIRNDVLRVDYNPVDDLNVSYRMLRNTQTNQWPWGSWLIRNNFVLTPVEESSPGLSHMFQFTKTFSPTLVNEARFAYTRSYPHSDFADPDKVSRAAFGNLPQLFPDPGERDMAPNISFGGQPNAPVSLDSRPGQPWYWRGKNFTFADNLSKVWNRHTLKAGFNWDHYLADATDTRFGWAGQFNFGRDVNNPFDANHGFANALLGNFGSYSELSARARKDSVLDVFEMYVQDNWRISPRLTLDFGLRTVSQPPEYDRGTTGTAHFNPAFYEEGKSPVLYTPTLDAAGKRVGMDPITKTIVPAAFIGLFVPGSGDPANGSRVAGVDGYPKGLFTRDWIFLAPRLGFAYDLFGTGNTALRGGFGMFYDTADANSFESSVGNPPLSYTPVQFYGNLEDLASSAGLIGPSQLGAPAAFGHVPLPTTMNFSLGVQHQAPGNMIFEVSYVGSLVRHRLIRREINPIPMFARFDPANADPTRPGKPLPDNFFRRYLGYDSIMPYEMTGTSNYNALQASLNRRFARGLQFGISYTFSKALGTTAASPYFPARDRNYGPLPQDRTHVFVANYMYELPNLGARIGFRPAVWILDNWQLSGITSFVTGAPFTPGYSTVDGQDITGSSEGARIDVVGDIHLDKSQRSFYQNFNTSAFARPAFRTFGNAGVNILRGPGVNNWDIAIAKQFPLWSETRYFQFRTEFFNAWNHTQFSALDTMARFDGAGKQVSSTFGAFTAARSPRIIQFSARLVF